MRLEAHLLIALMMTFLFTACGQQKPVPRGVVAGDSIPSTQIQNNKPKVKPTQNPAPQTSTTTTVASTTSTSTTSTMLAPAPRPSPAPTPTTTPTAATSTTSTTVPEALLTTDSEIQLLPGMQESDFEKRGDAIPTVYYKARYELVKQTCEDSEKLQILDPTDHVLVELCPKAHADCTLQGSCLIVDEDGLSMSINYVRNINKIPRFVEIDSKRCPFGLGVQNLCLDPFFTVAADLSFFKAGDVLYVPALAGLELPRGVKHHGFLIVRDRGGGIKGDHRFDFFSGFYHYSDLRNPFSKIGLQDQKNRFPYYKVTGESAELILNKRAYPELPSRRR